MDTYIYAYKWITLNNKLSIRTVAKYNKFYEILELFSF